MFAVFVKEYLELLDYCSSKNYDILIFTMRHDQYAKAYQRLDQAEQGAIAEKLAETLD
jgi:hypothetical protein